MGEARRKFDHDFREGAVRLIRETGKPIAPRAAVRVTCWPGRALVYLARPKVPMRVPDWL